MNTSIQELENLLPLFANNYTQRDDHHFADEINKIPDMSHQEYIDFTKRREQTAYGKKTKILNDTYNKIIKDIITSNRLENTHDYDRIRKISESLPISDLIEHKLELIREPKDAPILVESLILINFIEITTTCHYGLVLADNIRHRLNLTKITKKDLLSKHQHLFTQDAISFLNEFFNAETSEDFLRFTQFWWHPNNLRMNRTPLEDIKKSAYEAYLLGRNESRHPTIGEYGEVVAFISANKSDFYRLNFPMQNWTLQVNDAWITGAAHEKKPFRIITDIAKLRARYTMIRSTKTKVASVYHRELNLLEGLGYKMFFKPLQNSETIKTGWMIWKP